MATFKCKMCGGDLLLTEGSKLAECEYCGSLQTVPSADDERKLALFARANRLRAACEFDKAAGLYESIAAEFPEEAEAYWGLILCKYGIEYVDDPATGKKIPTCHRSSFDGVMESEAFEQVMEYSDINSRRVYREEAKFIEELRRRIIEVSGREEPYDLFICYKETDPDGNRTVDSVMAQEVYDRLTGEGYRVFFSRITLEDKLGQEYEPYIFAALNSAKIMLAFGTDYEYFNAVWVKNEWSRFLKLMEKDKSKYLIPCYKGIDAYDMPKEFARLQAQDMGKVGADQDLLRGIRKLLPKQAAAPAAAQSSGAQSGNSGQLLLSNEGMYTGEIFANNAHGKGRCVYRTFVYEGNWYCGKKEGQGTATWNRGGSWTGEWKNDNPYTGTGRLYPKNDPDPNHYYEGEAKAGAFCGRGKQITAAYIYEGEFLNGKSNGQGTITWTKGGSWTGEWKDDKAQTGTGRLYTANDPDPNHYYEGGLKDGMRSGKGKKITALWAYEGDYLNGKSNGQGTLTWAKGGTLSGTWKDDVPWNCSGIWREKDHYYSGSYVNGNRAGQGCIVWDDGRRLEGIWKDGVLAQGHGICKYDGGNWYEGTFENGKRAGNGTFHWNDGGIWTGFWKDGTPWDGNGVFHFENGVYEGPLQNGNMHGMGKMDWKKGGTFKGEFKNDIPWNGQGVAYTANGTPVRGPFMHGRSRF